MKKNNVVYNVVKVVFLLTSILLVNYVGIFYMDFSAIELIVLIIAFLFLHLLKFIRIYFILLEEKIPFKRIVKLYIKTTFVSIVLPFKIGELFKMYSYGKEINSYSKGIVAVIIEKFFDAVVLVLILIPFGIIKGEGISTLSILLLVFVILFIVVYFSFEGTYNYLNRFFIAKSQSKKTLVVLNVLNKLKNVYDKAKELSRERNILLISLTAIIWFVETMFVYIMSNFMNMQINFMVVVNYISDAFFGINNVLFNNYIYLCTAIFLVVIIFIYVRKAFKEGSILWKK